MTEDPLLVDAVDVVRAPGFEDGGPSIENLSPGINVFHGPNASGKTTLARSIEGLLWPDETGDRTSLTGRLSIDGDSWRVDVDPGRARYQRNGQETSGPTLPPADQRDRYHLALHDLLQQDTRNESFARRIDRESAGGFDLAAAHEELGFEESPSSRRLSVVQALEGALEDSRNAKDDVRELHEEQTRLTTLRGELEEARQARERVDLLEQAIEYAEARSELEETRANVAEFPDVISELDGSEADDVAETETRIDDLEDTKAEAEDTASEAREDLADADLPEDGLGTGTIDRLKNLRDELEALEERKRTLETDLRDAEARRESALSDIPLEIDEDDLMALESDDWGDLWADVSAFAREAETVRAEREIQDAVDRWLEADEADEADEAEEAEEAHLPDTDQATLERGSTALENWLANPTASRAGAGDTTLRIAIAAAVLLAIAGGLLAVLVHLALFVFAILGGVIGWVGYRSRGADGSVDARATHRDTFEGLGIEEPAAWSERDVRDRLNELYDAIAAHRIIEERDRLRDTLSTDVDELADKERALEERRSALQDRLGVAPDTADVRILAVAKGILRWQTGHDDVNGYREGIETVESQLESTREDLRDALQPYGYDDVTDSARATAHIRDLEGRSSTHETARREIERADGTIQEAEETIAELETERDAIFEKADIPVGEHEELRQLCERVEAYRKAVTERNNAEHLVEKEGDDLEGYPDYEPALAERSVPDLTEEKRELEAVADGYGEIKDEITEIETKIDEAKQSNDVEEALAVKDRALAAVADQLRDDYEAMVGHVLTGRIREATQASSRPEVLQRAGDVLARITKDRYRLDLDEARDSFRAYDTVEERGYALDELSSATRLQVLLSVRVGFVEQQEGAARLPLILDETLANSDDEKADVIIESMLELARDGRQVFYFTAQGDEVARWLSRLEGVEDIDHAVVDLADIVDAGDLDGHVDVPDLDDVVDHASSPPDPDGHDHDSYRAELGVPAFDPRRGAGHAHLWYVVDDVDLLYRLLDNGFDRWGQLENLLDRTDGSMITDDDDALADIERNGAALEAFVEAWQRGRGERVDRQVLQDSGAVSETFIDEVTELAGTYDGDAERIIAGLRAREVDRFRGGKTDDLERYFEENGYIKPVATLEPEEIRIRVAGAFRAEAVSRETAIDRADRFVSRLARSD